MCSILSTRRVRATASVKGAGGVGEWDVLSAPGGDFAARRHLSKGRVRLVRALIKPTAAKIAPIPDIKIIGNNSSFRRQQTCILRSLTSMQAPLAAGSLPWLAGFLITLSVVDFVNILSAPYPRSPRVRGALSVRPRLRSPRHDIPHLAVLALGQHGGGVRGDEQGDGVGAAVREQ